MQSRFEQLDLEETTCFNFVHDLIWLQAERHPNHAALVDEEGRRITYCELIERAGRLARRLRDMGVRPDDRVAVYMERSIELIVAILATLEAGGAYVPMDTSYPDARVVAILDNMCATAVITDRELPQGLTANVPIVHPINYEPSVAISRVSDLGPDHLAYVIHTSGSTGVPKGVAMSHRGLTRLIRWQIDDGPRALSTLQFTPLGFDVTFQEVFSTLCTGGTLFVVSDVLRRDPDRLLMTLKTQSIERLFLPYVALQQLAKASNRLGIVPQSLRHIITAGERLIITDAIVGFFRALPNCRLDNHYGPTEAHLVTSFTLSGDPSTWPSLPPIGRPVGGVVLYNLDEEMKPTPPCEVGELYVGGDGVARGYLNAPALTAERFLPDPFRPGSGAQIYKTGDIARIDADGTVHFVGRSDNQIKMRGFRIEPAEVELALTCHPQVRSAAVGLRTIAEDVDALVAYIVSDGPAATAAELSKHARSTLPSYMVPARFVPVDVLPLTPNGKVDHRALNAIDIPTAPTDEPTDEHTDEPLVDTVRAIWERVLGHNEIEPDDDFFDVGGDSLLATWVVTEISQAVGRDIDLSLLLRDSTIVGIAAALEEQALQKSGKSRISEIITLRPGPSNRALFLVHPLGGELIAYRALARAIKAPLRVLGLGWRPDDGANATTMSLEEMATFHFAQLRAIQPSGPYLLAGWSFGGVLAFEIAQQLIACGEKVDFLGLFDANPVRDPITGLRTKDSPHFDLLTNALDEIDQSLDTGEEAIDLSELFADPSWTGLLGGAIPEGVTAAHLRKNLLFARNSMRAAMDYNAAPYSGAIDLFQAAGSSPEIQESLAVDLRSLARGPMRIHPIAGDHCGILRAPMVDAMAGLVDEVLECI